MAMYDPIHREWNLFARVLQELLAAHGYRLGQLDDRARIHPEKVRRMQRSLLIPKFFPLLTSDEMERVCKVFALDFEEKIRLRAALFTTTIEATLMDRIDPEDALLAAEQIFPIIERALREHEGELSGLAMARGKGGLPSMSEEESEIDRKLGKALASIDQATMAMHLSRSGDDPSERIAYARKARDAYESALVQLEKADAALRASVAWQLWHEEVRAGLVEAKKRLAVLKA